MNTINTTEASFQFGRLDWNVSREVSNTVTYVVNWSNLFLLLEQTVIVAFIKFFCEKNSKLRTTYFCIFTLGCIVNYVTKFISFLSTNLNISFLVGTADVLTWYNKNFVTLWNLILALNRFTAIMFPLQFNQIWTTKRSFMVCLFLILYPFIIHSFNLGFLWCNCSIYFAISKNETNFEQSFGFVSDLTFSFLATACGFAAATKMAIKRKSNSQLSEKMLLFHSLISSIFLSLYSVTLWLNGLNVQIEFFIRPEATRQASLRTFLTRLGTFLYFLYHNLSLICLFIMSSVFRTKYLEFYRIVVVLKWFKKILKISDQNTTKVVPIAPATSPTALFVSRHNTATVHLQV